MANTCRFSSPSHWHDTLMPEIFECQSIVYYFLRMIYYAVTNGVNLKYYSTTKHSYMKYIN